MNQTTEGRRQKRRRPDLNTVYSINADGSRNFIQPADVIGKWQVIRNSINFLLMLVYVGLPWLQIADKPAVLINLPSRQAWIFGFSYTNQDFYLVSVLLTAAGFLLFVLTALLGRIWCGYACPQTVFMEGVFRKFERLLEGGRVARIRRNQGPLNFDKFWRKTVKHILFIFLSALIAHIFLSYFFPAKEVLKLVATGFSGHSNALFWTLFWTGILYFNFSWFREQTCLIICPYGRLQSSLIDADTIVIGYDEARGEPRTKGAEGGDCVDCYRCVEVCPTGIDIRNGLQMECIGCANCIDACNEIMKKIDKPEGLVRYDSQTGFETGKRKSFIRPRLYVYLLMALVGLTVATFAVNSRTSFHANVLRARGMPYAIEGERIRNLINLHIQNKNSEQSLFTIEIAEELRESFEIIVPQKRLRLNSMEDGETPIIVYCTFDDYKEPFPIFITVSDSLTGNSKQLEVMFKGP